MGNGHFFIMYYYCDAIEVKIKRVKTAHNSRQGEGELLWGGGKGS